MYILVFLFLFSIIIFILLGGILLLGFNLYGFHSSLLQLERGLHGLEPVVVATFPTKKYSDAVFSSTEDVQYVLFSLFCSSPYWDPFPFFHLLLLLLFFLFLFLCGYFCSLGVIILYVICIMLLLGFSCLLNLLLFIMFSMVYFKYDKIIHNFSMFIICNL